MNLASFVIITPARNEGQYLQRTIDSVLAQTLRPQKWILVNDGSTDDTGALIDAAAEQHSWIQAVHRSDRGFRQAGSGVVEAFYDGYSRLGATPWDYLVKLDGDLALAPDYFEQCFKHFHADPQLGLGGGLGCIEQHGKVEEDSKGDPRFHVRGATKIYRRACWQEIGGLFRETGWDTLDEVKANMLGWKTRTFRELRLRQLKGTGAADGAWRNSVKNGLANYIAGYHPLFMLGKCLKRAFARPYLVEAAGLWLGFMSGYLRGSRQVDDPALVQYLRGQQCRKMTLRPSIWD